MGNDTVGVAAPATTWYLAEGYNSSTFETFVLLMNPNATATTANVTFLKEDGSTLPYTRALPAKSRQTIITKAATLIPSGGFATKITAGQPIVVERAMYWSAGGVANADGHVTIGASQTATTWYFAEGYTSSTSDAFFMLMNPNATSGQATVKFIKDDGTAVNYSVTLPANSRKTVNAKSIIPSGGFGAVVTATVPIVAERAMYWSAGGVKSAGGHCSLGIPQQGTGSEPAAMLLWTR